VAQQDQSEAVMALFIDDRLPPLLKQANALLGAIYGQVKVANAKLKDVRFRLGCPGTLRLVFTSETRSDGMKVILFKVLLAAEADPTTATRELSVQVGADAPVVKQVPATETEVDGFEGPVDSAVHCEQVDIDDAGNRSTPSVLDAVIADTFPPQQPGQPAVVATGEKQV
jgi:hypothetical protein